MKVTQLDFLHFFPEKRSWSITALPPQTPGNQSRRRRGLPEGVPQERGGPRPQQANQKLLKTQNLLQQGQGQVPLFFRNAPARLWATPPATSAASPSSTTTSWWSTPTRSTGVWSSRPGSSARCVLPTSLTWPSSAGTKSGIISTRSGPWRSRANPTTTPTGGRARPSESSLTLKASVLSIFKTLPFPRIQWPAYFPSSGDTRSRANPTTTPTGGQARPSEPSSSAKARGPIDSSNLNKCHGWYQYLWCCRFPELNDWLKKKKF